MKQIVVKLVLILPFCLFFFLSPAFALEEPAIYNQNKSLLPKEVIPNPPPSKGIFDAFNVLKTFFSNLANPQKFFLQSQSLQQAYVPTELKETKANPSSIIDPILGKINNLLGGSTGYYDVNLPKEVQGGTATDSGQAFEQANFPDGINPITGQ